MDNLDKYRQNAHEANTRNKVFYVLALIMQNPEPARKRWVWELLQNALDAWHIPSHAIARDDSADHDRGLNVSIERTSAEGLVFKYDGQGFKMENVAHLIYSGTTKIDDPGTTGQFGTGFITTHLLSPTIHVSGYINHPGEPYDGKSFKFLLERKFNSSPHELEELMNHAWREFESSLSEIDLGNTVPTMFRYFPIESEANNAVQIGIKELKRSAQFLVTFNKGFSKINFKSDDETVSFSVAKREELPRENGLPKITEITVSEETNGTPSEQRHLLLVEDTETSTSIVMPTQLVGDARECLVVEETPRLFLQFPLVGTDDFSFPVIINSGQFTTLPTRDGVPFNDEDVNRKNWQAFEVACELLVSLLKYAASKVWSNAYTLAHIPRISQRDWLDGSLLRDNIRTHFIERICDTAVVLGEVGDSMSPQESVLPTARKDDNNVEILWSLLNDMQEKYAYLPKQTESVGWCRAVKSWKDIHDDSFGVGFDCQELAKEIDRKAPELEKEIREKGNTDKEETLVKILRLKSGIDPIDWLNRFHALIDREELRNEMDDYRIVLAQDGQLRKLSELHCDAEVAKELKNIAEWLEWPIRGKLRDGRIDSLGEKTGAGEWDDKYVVEQLIKKLRNRSDANPDDHFAKASVGIFKWIANHEDWNFLIDFPAFAEKSQADDDKKHVIKLQRVQEEDREFPYLAPVPAWMEELQHYSDLSPQSCVLANAFFEEVPNPDVWQALDAKGFAKNGVIIKRIKKDVEPIPDDFTEDKDEVKHFPAEGITVTNITFLTKDNIGIMSRVPGSQRLARLFWCFMVDWLLKHGPLNKLAKCADCGNEHRYPLAEWLTPVQENKWVPMGGRATARANAESLGKLFRGEPEAHSLNSERAANLLVAIGVSDPNTVRFTSATLEDQNTALDLLHKVQNNPDLADIVEKHVKQKEAVHKNQRLGGLVEELVKEILKDKRFNVHKTGIGSDFEIAAEIGDVATLELTHPGKDQAWLVEVKATSGNEEVKMTLTQAEEARREGDRYLLCVVPLEGGEPEKDTVRRKMRFVQNIGNDVAKLVSDFDDFKSRRDNITKGKNQGVQLSISLGTERILVKKSVWEKRGFPLDELAQKLKDF